MSARPRANFVTLWSSRTQGVPLVRIGPLTAATMQDSRLLVFPDECPGGTMLAHYYKVGWRLSDEFLTKYDHLVWAGEGCSRARLRGLPAEALDKGIGVGIPVFDRVDFATSEFDPEAATPRTFNAEQPCPHCGGSGRVSLRREDGKFRIFWDDTTVASNTFDTLSDARYVAAKPLENGEKVGYQIVGPGGRVYS